MRRGRIRIAPVGADQPVHHGLQRPWCLVPVHWRDNHDAVRRDPERIDFIHPVLHLAERIVRIAAARPMAQRHRGRYAGLAWVDRAAELGRRTAEIEDLDMVAGERSDRALRQLDQSPGLRHLARAGMLGSRRAVDEQDACGTVGVVVQALRLHDRVTRREPVDRKLVVRVGEAWAGLAGVRRLAAVRIGVPGRRRDRVQLLCQRREGRIGEARPEALLENLARQLGRRHALANVWVWHRGPR